MLKILSALLISACSINAYAASILPQISSSGDDGSFIINTDSTLFTDSDNIYNFTDFSILDNAALNITSSEPVFIYAQNSIYIDGSIFFAAGDLNLIAPEISFGAAAEFNLGTSGSITIVTTDATLSGDSSSASGSTITSDSSGSIVLSAGSDIAVISGSISSSSILIIEPVTSTVEGTFSITPTPVPLPAAGWLMLCGLSGLMLMAGKNRSRI